MLKRVILLIALVATALLPAAAANAERRVALVVGNSAYANAPLLRNPRNDASDMAAALKKLGFDVILGLDLDQQSFARMIEQYAQRLDGADVGLFYYAGHGLQINDKNYLVSTNAKLDNEFLVSSESIELDSVVRLMESKTAVNIVFLDACRNDPLADNLRRSLVAMNRSADLGRGLARIQPSGRDTLVAFAAAPGQEAADGRQRNSPFTGSLIKHLPTPGLEVSVMLKQVAADVRRETNNAQRPQQLSDMSRTFYFAPAATAVAANVPAQKVEVKAPAVPSLPGVDDRALEIAFWNAAQAANECEAMQDYVRRFPNGNFVTLAELAERRLCAKGRRIDVVAAPSGATPQPEPQAPPAPPPAQAVALPSPQPPSPQPPAPQPLSAEPPQTQTAILAPAGATPEDPIDPSVVRDIQSQLIRLGCVQGEASGQWEASTQAALRAFNSGAGTSLDVDRPVPATVETLSRYPDRACRGKQPAESEPRKAEHKPEHRREKPRREKVEHEPRRKREHVERERRRPPKRERVEREYARPYMRGRVFDAPRPPVARVQPPAQEKPYVCLMDEGYGRTKRCDAGSR
jgi:uncharacterized caspase-like protein